MDSLLAIKREETYGYGWPKGRKEGNRDKDPERMHMRVLPEVLQRIMELHGEPSLSAYMEEGEWRIGYGCRRLYSPSRPVREGDTVTMEETDRTLREQVRWLQMSLKKRVRKDFTSEMLSALVMAAHRMGYLALTRSRLIGMVNIGAPEDMVRAEWFRGATEADSAKREREWELWTRRG